MTVMSSSTRISDGTDSGDVSAPTDSTDPTDPGAATESAPAISGALRDCSTTGRGRRKLRSGDIAIITASDLSRREAQFLIDAAPAAVVNTGPFTTGAVPNYGLLMLLDAGIPLFADAGPELRSGFRDGAKKGRIDAGGTIHNGRNHIATARAVHRDGADPAFDEAQEALIARMEAFFGNTIEFLHSESALLIDGLGIPDVGDAMQGRKVLVVSPGTDHRSEVRQLRNFIREFNPVLIGVGSAADTLAELGHDPTFVVGDPAEIGADTLRSGVRVILPADPDGHATGLERIQDLGVGAMTFPSAIESPTELALLLAADHGAELVVNAGAPLDLDDLFADRKNATPAALITRMKVGGSLVDASAITKLYHVGTGSGNLAWLWALLGILVAIAAVIVVIGVGGDGTFTENMANTWDQLAEWLSGLVN